MSVDEGTGEDGAPGRRGAVLHRTPARRTRLTTRLNPGPADERAGLAVDRFLPARERRTVGAWCFLDRYGPDDVSPASGSSGMQVGPHPHTGLQTVSWLLQGEVRHTDSLGSRQRVRPGELSLMTAGRGIAHAEVSEPQRPDVLEGVQLWIALPEAARRTAPAFEHHAQLPVLEREGVRATVLLGVLDGVRSPATTHSPLLGADLALESGAEVRLPVPVAHEHAVLVLSGRPRVAGAEVGSDELLHLGTDRDAVEVAAPHGGARLLLLGGQSLGEPLLMWWNFVGRTHDEVVADRDDWEAGAQRFGTVPDPGAPRIPAPPLPAVRLRPRP